MDHARRREGERAVGRADRRARPGARRRRARASGRRAARPRGRLSAGFDLRTFERGLAAGVAMVRAGAELVLRLLAFPQPVLTVCTGHAYPAGAFLMLAADVRLGAAGPWRIGMNEVAIALTVPNFAVELARHRLTPPGFARITSAAMFAPGGGAAPRLPRPGARACRARRGRARGSDAIAGARRRQLRRNEGARQRPRHRCDPRGARRGALNPVAAASGTNALVRRW